MVTALDTPHYHSEEHNCVSRVSCERKAIERITKFQALKTMNDTNKKKKSWKNTGDMCFSKCKKSVHEAAQGTDHASGKDCIKVAGLWRGKLSRMIS